MPLILLSALGWLKDAAGTVISFCAKPPGSYLALVTLAALSFWFSGQRGYDRGQSDCQTAHQVAVDREVSRQKVAVVGVVARSNTVTAVNATINQSNQEKVKHVAAQSAALPTANDECISRAVADELRDIK